MDVDWLELLADHPAFRKLPEMEQSSRLSRNLLSVHRGDLYAWNEREGALICVNLKQLHEEEEKNVRLHSFVCEIVLSFSFTPVLHDFVQLRSDHAHLSYCD